MNRRIKRTLLEDVKIIYFTIPCHSKCCEYCKNEQLCITTYDLLNSLIKYY